MADQPSVFESPKPTENVATKPSPKETLVGEGRKYKSEDELAEAYMNADSFIEKLKEENRKLREEFSAEKARADTLDKLVLRHQSEPVDQAPATNGAAGAPSLSPEQIRLLVRQEVTGRETESKKTANLQKADAALKSMFGEKALEVYRKAATDDATHEAYMSLAAVNPDAFVKLFQTASAAPSAQADAGTTHNTVAVGDPNNSGRVNDPGTKEYYEALRKKERNKYYSHAVQLQMTKAAEADPDKFFGRKR